MINQEYVLCEGMIKTNKDKSWQLKKGETQKATEWIGIYAEHIRKVALVTMNIITI